MELKLFLVMALISVHVNAQLQTENTTMAGFNTTDTFQQSTITENPAMSNVTENQTKSNEVEDQTTGASFNAGTDQTTQQPIVTETSSISTTKAGIVEGTTDESTPVKFTSTTKQTSEGTFDVTTSTHVERSTLSDKTEFSTENTMSGKTKISTITTGEQRQEVTTTLSTTETTTKTTDKSTSVMPEEKATTMVNEKDHGIMSTGSSVEKTSTENSPEQFFNWLDNIKQKNHTDTNATEKEENTYNDRTNNLKNSIHDHHHNAINPEKMSPKEFFEWLDSIHPDSNSTTVKNIIDTSIISTGKLIIVISTICGTFVLFVAILIAISCCRRKRNLRNDSEKSDFSMNSVISVPEKRNSQTSDIFTPDKNGFNNVFMGIPANNDVWKKLEQLSPTASAVMPESTKM